MLCIMRRYFFEPNMTVCTNVLKTTDKEHKNSNWVRLCVTRILDRLVTVLGLVLVVLGL